MISITTIWGITLRYLRLYKRDVNILLALLYWPILDIITWGFLGSWIQQSGMTKFHNYEMIALLGVLLWQVVGRGGNTLSFTLCEELWQGNVINLFSLPLTMIEWILGIILYYAITMIGIALSSLLFIYALYEVSLTQIIANFLFFLPPLFFCGIWLGFTCLCIVVLLGKRGVELGFVAVWFLLPFSGAYYPIEILPPWGQTLSHLFPMSYIFTGMRSYLSDQQSPWPYLAKGYPLSILYALAVIIIFLYCFNRSRKQGLARLED